MRHFIAVRIKRGQIGPEGRARRAGEGRYIDHQRGFIRITFGQRIRKNHAPFRIRRADLDGEAFARCHHILRAERIARDAVFHRRNQHAQPHGQLRRDDKLREAKHQCRTAHIFLHQLHARIGLEVEPTRIERDALADQHHQRVRFFTMRQLDEARGLACRAADGVNGRVVLFQQRIADDFLERSTALFGHRARRCR